MLYAYTLHLYLAVVVIELHSGIACSGILDWLRDTYTRAAESLVGRETNPRISIKHVSVTCRITCISISMIGRETNPRISFTCISIIILLSGARG